MGAGDLNSGSHICMGSTLPRALSPAPEYLPHPTLSPQFLSLSKKQLVQQVPECTSATVSYMEIHVCFQKSVYSCKVTTSPFCSHLHPSASQAMTARAISGYTGKSRKLSLLTAGKVFGKSHPIFLSYSYEFLTPFLASELRISRGNFQV